MSLLTLRPLLVDRPIRNFSLRLHFASGTELLKIIKIGIGNKLDNNKQYELNELHKAHMHKAA